MASHRIGQGLSLLVVLFLVFDAVMKLAKPQFIVAANTPLGVPERLIVGIGLILLACVVIYVLPATSGLGAVLLTGYLGGAVAIHLRAGSGWFELLFPVMVGALVWGGLILRNPQVRQALFR